jgi:hypothetical protein
LSKKAKSLFFIFASIIFGFISAAFILILDILFSILKPKRKRNNLSSITSLSQSKQDDGQQNNTGNTAQSFSNNDINISALINQVSIVNKASFSPLVTFDINQTNIPYLFSEEKAHDLPLPTLVETPSLLENLYKAVVVIYNFGEVIFEKISFSEYLKSSLYLSFDHHNALANFENHVLSSSNLEDNIDPSHPHLNPIEAKINPNLEHHHIPHTPRYIQDILEKHDLNKKEPNTNADIELNDNISLTDTNTTISPVLEKD